MRPLIGIIGQMDPSTNRLFLDGRHVEKILEAGGMPAVFKVGSSPPRRFSSTWTGGCS